VAATVDLLEVFWLVSATVIVIWLARQMVLSYWDLCRTDPGTGERIAAWIWLWLLRGLVLKGILQLTIVIPQLALAPRAVIDPNPWAVYGGLWAAFALISNLYLLGLTGVLIGIGRRQLNRFYRHGGWVKPRGGT
jgi:hypothetical protein